MSERSDFNTLKELLSSWNLSQLFQHFQDEGMNVEELQLMKRHHVTELLHNYKLGVRVRFEHNFEIWRRNMNKPLQDGSKYVHCCPTTTTIAAPPTYQHAGVSQKSRATNTDAFNSRLNTPTPPLSAEATNTNTTAINCTELLKEMPRLTPQPRPAQAATPTPLNSVGPSSTSAAASISPQDQPPSALQIYTGGDQKPLTVLQILQTAGPKGEALLKYYQEHHEFTTTHRTLLIYLVVSFFDSNDYHLSLNMSHNLEWEILKLFPTEKLEYYRTEKRGKIYVKFCNMKRYKRDRDRVPVKRKWDGGAAAFQANMMPNDVEVVDAAHGGGGDDDDDDDFAAISFGSWTDQQPNDVQIKTENLSDDAFY